MARDASSTKGHKGEGSKHTEKRKSSELKGGKPPKEKRRKLDEIEHVPTLVSSTFNPLEEIDFPRGGGSALTPLEKKEAENEGIRDALFEVSRLGMLLTGDCSGGHGKDSQR
jgi:hypothetical protein